MSNPIREPVPGAPYQPGQKVLVVGAVDDAANHRRIGRSGVVECLHYDGGRGERYPDDPMIGVRFGKRTVDEFWAEELEAAQ